MSEAHKNHFFADAPEDRPKLYRVEQRVAPPTSGPTSGLSWARAYRTRLVVSDTLVIAASVAAAFLVQLRFSPAPVTLAELRPDQWALYGVILVVWSLMLAAFHTRDHRLAGAGAAEYKQVITACVMTFGLLAMSLLVLEWEAPGRYFVLTLPIGVLALVMNRWLWRRWLTRQRRFGHYLSRVVVIGSNDDVDYVVTRIEERLGAAYIVVGIVL